MPRVPAAKDGFLPSKVSIVYELEAPSLLLDGLWIVGVGPSKSGCPGELGCSVGIIDPLLDDQSTFPILFKGQKVDEYSLESLLRNPRQLSVGKISIKGRI